MHGAPRSAGIGSANSLVAENAAAIRRREARTELMERLNRTVSMDIDALYDFASDYDPPRTQRGRAHRPFGDEDEDMDLDGPDFASGRPRTPPRRPLRLPRPRNASPEVPDFSGARTPPRRPLRLQRLRDASPDDSRIPTGDAVRPRSSLDLDQEPEEPPTASSSSVNPVAGANTWRPRRPVARFRQHNIHSEISPPPSATASVDRRHASWEAPSRDAGVSNTYQYLSAISDLAQTITSPSNDEPLRTPPSPIWPENESPFSTLFARSGAGPSSTRPTPASLTRPTPGASSSSRDPETNRDFSSNAAESRVPSLPPPDLGGDFERSGDMLRSTISNGAGANVTMFPSARSITPPTPPPHNPYTGPFRLTMQRREEQARRAARRVPDPPSIPPLSFGRDFDHPTAPPSQEQSHLRQLAARLDAHRSELSPSARFEEAERRLFNYRGPSTSRAQDGDPRRFFPSRPTATSSTSQAEEPPQPRRYSATDMHNVLARQARLEGSRLAPDLPSRLDPDLPSTWRLPRGNTAGASTDISHDPSSSASVRIG
ncbi:hypothetical protein C8R46DRAFT_619236 [Mycena filopes]|nr:hypothetical protein C8R46DRAFT_619236 [Mycena filopes]